jgi:hypothetical protein
VDGEFGQSIVGYMAVNFILNLAGRADKFFYGTRVFPKGHSTGCRRIPEKVDSPASEINQ